MNKSRILVADDSEVIIAMMKEFLEKEGYRVATASSAQESLPLIQHGRFDLVIMDIKMPGMDGLAALAEIKKIDPKLSVIMMTAFGSTQTAIEAMKSGAYDYITKPFNIKEVKALIKKAIDASKLMKESVSCQASPERMASGDVIIGKTKDMLEVYKTIGQVADSSATVLIRGESGTGKELVARAIYQNSSRKDKPFLAVNCAAIPESLLESELFGHERGAFTGALNKRIGKFQQCDTGTIFLDEIGDMSLSTQTKILRVLQEHTFEPVGSENTMKVDVRVLASTNKDLDSAIEKKEFREDLYYRLKVVTIYLPSLRQRRDDIPLLVDYFIKKFNRELCKSIKGASAPLMERLSDHDWPGNVRELENAVQTAMIMSKKDILLLDNFPLFVPKDQAASQRPHEMQGDEEKKFTGMMRFFLKGVAASAGDDVYKNVMEWTEKILIEKALNDTGSNQINAAKILGISRNTLRSRMKKYGFK